MIGFDLQDPIFSTLDVDASLASLQQPDRVLFNRFSRPEFGDRYPGLQAELRGRRIEVAELFELSNTLRADGMVILSDQNFARLHPGRSLDQINLGLIAVAPGTDVDELVVRLRQRLPATVSVLSRAEAIAADETYWISNNSMGLIISLQLVMAVLVGAVIIYQVLVADVSERLSEYGVLKAMGFSNRQICFWVLQQAWLLSVLGAVPGVAISAGLYQIIWLATRLPIVMTGGQMLVVLSLNFSMCSVSGYLAARKVLTKEPADVF